MPSHDACHSRSSEPNIPDTHTALLSGAESHNVCIQFMGVVPKTDAPLLRLPAEVLVIVLAEISSEDKTCLAITCKRLLQMSTILPFSIPSVKVHRFYEPCNRMQRLMCRMRPRDDEGQEKKTIAICNDCLRYRPKRGSYWEDMPRDGVSETDWKRQLALWSTLSMGECPQCWYKRTIEDIHQLAVYNAAQIAAAQIAAAQSAQNMYNLNYSLYNSSEFDSSSEYDSE